MCGIAGILSKKSLNPDLISSMIKELRHRGPDYSSTLLLYYIYEAAFMFWDTAYATTLSVVLILLLCVIAIGQFFVLDKKVHYQ